jgi:hypothetical protein
MKLQIRGCVAISCVFIIFLASLGGVLVTVAQDIPPPPPPPGLSKEQVKEYYKRQKEASKQETKRQKEIDKANSRLEKQIPVGKTVEYDRFKDVTTVSTHGMVVYPMDRDMTFATAYVGILATYSVQGQLGTVPPTVRLVVTGQSLLVGTPSSPCTLSMIVDGTRRMQLGQMQYGRPTAYAYVAWVDLSLTTFRAIASASSIDFQTCRFETTLNQRHITGLAALLEGLPAVGSDSANYQMPADSLDPFAGTWKFQVARGGIVEEWILRMQKNGSLLQGSLKTPTTEIPLPNMVFSGTMFSGSASEMDPLGLNMMTISGQVSHNSMNGKLTIYLLSKQQPIVAFEAKRISIP